LFDRGCATSQSVSRFTVRFSDAFQLQQPAIVVIGPFGVAFYVHVSTVMPFSHSQLHIARSIQAVIASAATVPFNFDGAKLTHFDNDA
jgi:hypothetical protein